MASDAHSHPYDLLKIDSAAEAERKRLGVACAASAWREDEFLFQEKLARESRQEAGPPMLLCFGAHPQLARENPEAADRAVNLLPALVREKRIAAVGEIGFDYFDESFRASAVRQRALFEAQIELARAFSLPCVLHLRRAMHEAFAYAKKLASLPAVILHSYSGTEREARDLLKRGVNAYFSFGTTILLNHKQAMNACAKLPSDRLLTETDAPYQKRRGTAFSSWSDLAEVIGAAAALRKDAGSDCGSALELEERTDINFRRAYGL